MTFQQGDYASGLVLLRLRFERFISNLRDHSATVMTFKNFSSDTHFSFSLPSKVEARFLRRSCNLLSPMSQLR